MKPPACSGAAGGAVTSPEGAGAGVEVQIGVRGAEALARSARKLSALSPKRSRAQSAM